MARHLHIDPFSGIAGDMFLGAAIDLGADPHALQHALADAGLEQPFHLHHHRVLRQGIGGVNVTVRAGEHHHHDHGHDPHHHHGHGHDHGPAHDHGHHHHHDHGDGHGHDHDHGDHHHHHHVGRRAILAIAERLPLTGPRARWARAVVEALAQAEARVHGMSPDEVHFHEVGAVDSIVDMLGSVWALEALGITSVTCGPVPVSRGSVRCAHGLMPVPAPATAYLLEGRPVVGVDRVGELVTPTGAALIAGLCDPADHRPLPAMTLEKVGYGAGDRDFAEAPNLLRLLVGRPVEAAAAEADAGVEVAVASA